MEKNPKIFNLYEEVITMKKITLFAPNGRMIFARISDEENEITLSMRQLSYLLAGLPGWNHCFRVNDPAGACVNVSGYDGGYSTRKHTFRIEESDNGFRWLMIPGLRRPRRKARA
jgi:hypothetical protein